MELEARAWTTQLSRAESDILQASQRLEKAFKEANKRSVESHGQEIPDPVKLVRRLTALEIALGSLKSDCEMISTKRTEIVKSVMERQLNNVSQLEQMFSCTTPGTANPFCQSVEESQEEEESWRDLTQRLKQQHYLLSDGAEG